MISVPFLLLSPAALAKDHDKEEKAAEIAESDQSQKEKGNERRAQEAAKRAEEAEERAKEAAQRAAEKAKRADEAAEAKRTKEGEKATAPGKAPKSAPQPPAENPGKSDMPAKGKGRSETAPGRGKRDEERPAPETRERRERPDSPATPAIPATPATPTTPATPAIPAVPPADEKKPTADMPVAPDEPRKPGEMKPRGNKAVPGKNAAPEPAPEREIAEIPASEPERQAETQVTEVTREVQRDLDQRKTRIGGREEARALIDEILGAESRISRAELAREERFRPRFERPRSGDARFIEVSPDQRREAATYYQERLLGRKVEGPPPVFFRRDDRRRDGGDVIVEERVVERVDFIRPRYLNEGRRYVHYDSRAAIPAILMAAQAMNQVRFQPTREIAPIFYERQEVSAPYAMPLPPENYRNEESVVVSYPVDENSMISSEDILFLQGSTQFSDPYSYDVIGVMADAMKAMPEEERFVIEGHASAEGSYESNMILSQQRAEHIVREIVRRGGVSPYRLLPVGYGESEARHPAEAAEHLRGQDRRVVVFRMKSEPIAQR